MAKATKKRKGKRTVTCGKCKKTGHNSRTCKPTAETTAPVVKKEIKSSADIPPPPTKKIRTKIDERREKAVRRNVVPKRDAPTAGNTSVNDYAPYRCPKCHQVAILVVVRVKDHGATFRLKKDVFVPETRCEKCFTKPPSDLILKWGAYPNEVVPVTSDA